MRSSSQGIRAVLLVCLCFVLLWGTGCRSTKDFARTARFDEEAAKEAIIDLAAQPVVLILPTESKKRNLLAKAGELKKVKQLDSYTSALHRTLVDSFGFHFIFTDVLFMPDTCVANFEQGLEGAYFVNSDMKLDPDIYLEHRTPFKLLFGYDDMTMHLVRGVEIIPNPMPNNLKVGQFEPNKSMVSKLMGNAWNENDIADIALMWSMKLQEFYEALDKDIKYQEIRKAIR